MHNVIYYHSSMHTVVGRRPKGREMALRVNILYYRHERCNFAQSFTTVTDDYGGCIKWYSAIGEFESYRW
jgi:hypothetical protein